METLVIYGALLVIAVSIGLCLVRAVRGPTLFDRVLAFDCMALNVVGGVVLVSILFHTDAFLDVVLVVALLGFLGTVSIATYLEGTLVDS
jgi:multisubunit Na+/H+ antiporter MnhF subunit